MKNSKLIKHIAEISAGLMFAVGAGAVVSSQNVTPVQAAQGYKMLEGKHITTDEGEEMMPLDEYLQKAASWNSTPNPYKLNGRNNIKFHWYKKAHVRGAWDNTDTNCSQAFNVPADSTTSGGKVTVMGTVNVNGVHYYITGDDEEQEMIYRGARNLHPSEYFEQPKLGYVTKTVHSYSVGEINSSAYGDGYTGIGLGDDDPVKINKGHTILIPSHHQAVELFGTKYVPVLDTNYGVTGGTLIKESDFQKYVTSGEGHKFNYNGDINYQKNGKVYSTETDVYQAAKIESRKLKSAKRRKSYEKRIINDLKHDKKMQTLYGLA